MLVELDAFDFEVQDVLVEADLVFGVWVEVGDLIIVGLLAIVMSVICWFALSLSQLFSEAFLLLSFGIKKLLESLLGVLASLDV